MKIRFFNYKYTDISDRTSEWVRIYHYRYSTDISVVFNDGLSPISNKMIFDIIKKIKRYYL